MGIFGKKEEPTFKTTTTTIPQPPAPELPKFQAMTIEQAYKQTEDNQVAIYNKIIEFQEKTLQYLEVINEKLMDHKSIELHMHGVEEKKK